jgi:predicted RNase H-like HicB family nuclease
MTMYYLALVIEAPDGLDFICPDVPGFTAHSASRDFGEAVAVARQVLAGHLATLIDAGGELPRARNLAELRSDPEFVDDFAEATTTVLLPALVPAGRSVRVNLSLDENTLALMDSSARDRSLTRSAFVAEACRAFVTGGRSASNEWDIAVAAFAADEMTRSAARHWSQPATSSAVSERRSAEFRLPILTCSGDTWKPIGGLGTTEADEGCLFIPTGPKGNGIMLVIGTSVAATQFYRSRLRK